MRFLLILFTFFPLFVFNQTNPDVTVDKRVEILKNAEKHLGLRYRSRVGKSVFDCSGFVKYLMAGIGKNVTRSSVTQIHDGKRIKDIKEAKPGDIIVFKGRNHRNNRPGHVGLVHHWSNDTLYFIHSSVAKGIVIDRMSDPYYAKRYLQVRDVLSQ
jgi:cell wall-associated NlpC family hydrolase